MALYLLMDNLIATTPIAIIPMEKITNAMAMIQSISPIDAAARSQNKVFVLYIIVLVAGGLLTAGLTVWLWKATNRYQEAVKSDADARIAEAEHKTAIINERALKLVHENLVLRSITAFQTIIVPGRLRVGSNIAYPLVVAAGVSFDHMKAIAGVAPTGAAIHGHLLRDGTPWGGTFTIAIGITDSGPIAPGPQDGAQHVYTLDITQIGSAEPGRNLTFYFH